jgi:hypothetical protein
MARPGSTIGRFLSSRRAFKPDDIDIGIDPTTKPAQFHNIN